MTTARSRWDETRALIEAGQDVLMTYLCDGGVVQRLGEPCPECGALPSELCKRPSEPGIGRGRSPNTDWDDIKRAEADADRMLYGNMFAARRGDE